MAPHADHLLPVSGNCIITKEESSVLVCVTGKAFKWCLWLYFLLARIVFLGSVMSSKRNNNSNNTSRSQLASLARFCPKKREEEESLLKFTQRAAN